MDLGVLITAGIGIVTTFCSALFTFLFTRRKYNAEVDSAQIANMKTSLDIYQDMVKDLGRKLDLYSKIVDKNKSEVIRLKSVVIKMIGKICTIESCKNRCPYSDSELDDLFRLLDFDIDETDYKENYNKE
jgi:hypothetical protein